MPSNDFHGIIINRSQKEQSFFKDMDILGKKNVLFGIIVLYKIRVKKENLNQIIKVIRNNMASRLFFMKQEFYSHFYRNTELIVVFRNKVFSMTTDKSSWKKAIKYGRSLGIAEKQLDFSPNRLEDETF